MFLYICKQTFHISRVPITQKVNAFIMRNLRQIVFMWRQRYVNFQICISVPLSLLEKLILISCFLKKFKYLFQCVCWLFGSHSHFVGLLSIQDYRGTRVASIQVPRWLAFIPPWWGWYNQFEHNCSIVFFLIFWLHLGKFHLNCFWNFECGDPR